MNRKKIFYWLAAIIMPAMFSACSSGNAEKADNADSLKLPVITLKAKDTVLQKAYVADIQAVKNVEIRTRVKGFLEKIFVDEGMLVKKGQLLFKINDQEYRVMLSKAKAELSNAVAAARAAELEVERTKLLVNKKVIAKSELDVAETKLAAEKATIEEARSSVQSAENHLAYTAIHAPFDGIIDRIPLKAGSLIEEGALLTDLSDISAMYAYFSFPENEYLQYQRASKTTTAEAAKEVKLVLSDGSNYSHPGQIETVEGQIEQNTGSIAFRARFPNPQKLLRHGATGKLYISTDVDDVLLVPQQSVFDIQDKSYVYVVDKHNMLHMQSFTPVTRLAHYYVVREGLKPGDRILFAGTQNVREGMVIKPTAAPAAMLAMKQ
ncbi:efflux RND transporter periplasmic adaptor subunit [Mucilaginibacter sp. KACC 22063]|uniref:efflux RND transporter periplasmic adaptor subunit n=1 Tax=Mucilaginibacter sp. KACC 22063 TaxID=3025666 RepID=UPI002364FD5A|nr:efflux RND transporter periplasmic adaptor subunit [Mucilaginibacter sp. KACC 22063]WDF56953.1 efflux RND transporter periplasmic adaptor subunit [Mucilaginibacter sp. KACC 22063]